MNSLAASVGQGMRWVVGAGIAIALASAAAAAAEPLAAPVQGGMRMYRDPETGAVGGPPAAKVERRGLTAAEAAAPAASELRAEPVTAPAGGVKINLRGQFQSAVSRQAGPHGALGHQCSGPAGSAHE